MPVIDSPSIWDYIANAGGQAITSYQQAQDKVRQQAEQNAGLLTQLFGAGAINSDQLAPAVSKIPGMGQVKIQPSKQEKAATPGTPENLAEQASVGETQQKLQKQDILKRWSGGQPVTEQEALIAGVPTAQDMALAKSAKVNASLDEAGKQYVDAQFLAHGGRINPHEAIDIAANAYQKYVKDYQDAGLGTLTQSDLQNAQRYFAGRAMDRLTEQRKLDIEAVAAANRGNNMALSREDKMFSNLTGLIESNRKAQADFLKSPLGAAAELKVDLPDNQIPPAFLGAVRTLRALKSREKDLQAAQGQAAMGVIPKNFAHLLSDTDTGTGAPPPSTAAPAPDPIANIKAAYKSGKLTAAQIRSSKMITAQQKDEILGGNITLKK